MHLTSAGSAPGSSHGDHTQLMAAAAHLALSSPAQEAKEWYAIHWEQQKIAAARGTLVGGWLVGGVNPKSNKPD